MPMKRQPSDAELDALAGRFRAMWRDGNAVHPWLRKHHAMIRDLVDDEWSWLAVADALTRAGITWRTGRPWSAEGLRRTVDRAAIPLKSRGKRQSPSPGFQPHVQSEASPPMVAADRAAADGVSAPRFRPARPKPYEPPRPLTPAEEQERTAIHKKLYG